MKQREALGHIMLTHPDIAVRSGAADVLALWRDARSLRSLLDDRTFLVRKSAMYGLGKLPTDPAIAEVAWDYWSHCHQSGTHAEETLDTFLRHAGREDAEARMLALALDDEACESVRTRAVYALDSAGATSALTRMMPCLTAPPAVTWALHIALLDAAAKYRLPTPPLSLSDVDNVHLQSSLGAVLGG